jgi:hypothetical protein
MHFGLFLAAIGIVMHRPLRERLLRLAGRS